MNKQISTGTGIVVIIVIVLMASIILWAKLVMFQAPAHNSVLVPVKKATTNNQQEVAPKTMDQSCLNSGGSIETSSCCQSAGDFPNSCAIGACGCASANSHQVKTCNCGEGKCFDGNSCVSNKKIQ